MRIHLLIHASGLPIALRWDLIGADTRSKRVIRATPIALRWDLIGADTLADSRQVVTR